MCRIPPPPPQLIHIKVSPSRQKTYVPVTETHWAALPPCPLWTHFMGCQHNTIMSLQGGGRYLTIYLRIVFNESRRHPKYDFFYLRLTRVQMLSMGDFPNVSGEWTSTLPQRGQRLRWEIFQIAFCTEVRPVIFRYQLHNFLYQLHNFLYQLHNFLYQLHNFLYQLHNFRYHLHNFRYQLHNFRYQLHNFLYQLHNFGYQLHIIYSGRIRAPRPIWRWNFHKLVFPGCLPPRRENIGRQSFTKRMKPNNEENSDDMK